jgi:hypothetical protein
VNFREYIAGEIRRRATRLRLISAMRGDAEMIDPAEARLLAAREIAAERRAKERSALQFAAAGTTEGITVANARQWLLDKLAGMAERLKATANIEVSAPPPPQIRKHVLDPAGLSVADKSPAPSAPTNNEPEQPATEPIIGIYGTVSTAERIDDREFANSLRWGDRALEGWRRSLATNERIAREKAERSRWIG